MFEGTEIFFSVAKKEKRAWFYGFLFKTLDETIRVSKKERR